MVVTFVAVVGYTLPVIGNHGMNLVPIFFADIGKMEWPGQFNFDFMFMLILSASYVAWRHRFTPVGLLLAVGALFLGAPFLSAYLLIQSFSVDGDIADVLLGSRRVST